MTESADFVRPTRRALVDLGVEVPDLGHLLHELEHPVIMRAQQIPERERGGAAERVRSLTDRVWFKVKTADWRAAVAKLPRPIEGIPQDWWIGAAGPRTADSAQHDFYARLKADAFAGGRKTCSTDFLLPTPWDSNRLLAEAAVKAERVIRQHVREAAGQSLLNGDVRGFDVGDRNVRIRVKMLADGQAYLAVGATGSVDAAFMVVLLSAIPGVDQSDWMPEPSEGLGVEPAPGEVLWSTMVPAATQQTLLADARRDW